MADIFNEAAAATIDANSESSHPPPPSQNLTRVTNEYVYSLCTSTLKSIYDDTSSTPFTPIIHPYFILDKSFRGDSRDYSDRLYPMVHVNTPATILAKQNLLCYEPGDVTYEPDPDPSCQFQCYHPLLDNPLHRIHSIVNTDSHCAMNAVMQALMSVDAIGTFFYRLHTDTTTMRILQQLPETRDTEAIKKEVQRLQATNDDDLQAKKRLQFFKALQEHHALYSNSKQVVLQTYNVYKHVIDGRAADPANQETMKKCREDLDFSITRVKNDEPIRSPHDYLTFILAALTEVCDQIHQQGLTSQTSPFAVEALRSATGKQRIDERSGLHSSMHPMPGAIFVSVRTNAKRAWLPSLINDTYFHRHKLTQPFRQIITLPHVLFVSVCDWYTPLDVCLKLENGQLTTNPKDLESNDLKLPVFVYDPNLLILGPTWSGTYGFYKLKARIKAKPNHFICDAKRGEAWYRFDDAKSKPLNKIGFEEEDCRITNQWRNTCHAQDEDTRTATRQNMKQNSDGQTFSHDMSKVQYDLNSIAWLWERIHPASDEFAKLKQQMEDTAHTANV
jgi:hypothetical protein